MLLGYTVGYNKTEMSLKKESKSKSQVLSGLGVVGVVGVVDVVGTVVFGCMTADDGGGGSVVGVYDRERKRETGLLLLW